METFNDLLTSPVGLAAAAVAAFVIGTLFFNVKQWEAHWKQWAIDTSKAMSKAGLVHTPKILDGLAVGDLAGGIVGVPEPIRALRPLLRRLQAPEPEEDFDDEQYGSKETSARTGHTKSPPLRQGGQGGRVDWPVRAQAQSR